jgi:hypothetical protein
MSGLKDLVKLAGRLDSLGLEREADVLRAAFRKMAADGVSGTWQEGMPWSSSLGSDTSGSSEGMAASNRYESSAPFDPSMVGTARTTEEQSEKERYAKYRSLLPTARKIYVPQNFQTNENDFKESFIGGWKAYPNNPATKADWELWNVSTRSWDSWAEDLADILWNEKQLAAAPKPAPVSKTAPSPKPRGPIRDWAYYNSKQTDEFGKGMEKFWFRNAPKLGLEPDFNSFVRYYKKLAAIGGSERSELSPRDFIIFTINEIMNNTNVDSLVRYLADSKERRQNQTVHNNLSIYLGYNPNTGKLSLDAERQEARGLLNELKGIIEGRVRNSAR